MAAKVISCVESAQGDVWTKFPPTWDVDCVDTARTGVAAGEETGCPVTSLSSSDGVGALEEVSLLLPTLSAEGALARSAWSPGASWLRDGFGCSEPDRDLRTKEGCW